MLENSHYLDVSSIEHVLHKFLRNVRQLLAQGTIKTALPKIRVGRRAEWLIGRREMQVYVCVHCVGVLCVCVFGIHVVFIERLCI